MKRSLIFILFLLLLTGTTQQCRSYASLQDLNKIQFNYNILDDQGLRYGEYAVDYEFCIPAKTSCGKRILRIEPNANVLTASKGRSGCSKDQWLCIISTRNPNWKNKLFSVAALPFVVRINETFYE